MGPEGKDLEKDTGDREIKLSTTSPLDQRDGWRRQEIRLGFAPSVTSWPIYVKGAHE